MHSKQANRLVRAFSLLMAACFIVAAPTTGVAEATPGEQNGHRKTLPHIVLITVDALRADRLSIYGNPRSTSPNIDALLERGTRFNAARTPEPLTGPACASMLTSLHPHEHGSSRNGIPIRQGLRSLPKMLLQIGYVTAAFISNWTLNDKQSGLAEHFDVYEEVLNKKRWLFWFGEADAEYVRTRAIDWLENDGVYPGQPLFLWVHFVDPHAPYKLHKDFADRLGVPTDGSATAMQKYDTEIAHVDHEIGLLLNELDRYLNDDNTIYIFTSDHGEGLGEHGYNGHGRHLYEEELRIPLGISWRGHIPKALIQAPATLLDFAPSAMGLLDAPIPPEWQGHDWSKSLLNGGAGPVDRVTYHQAHKGAVKGGTKKADVAARKRRRGLIRLSAVQGRQKQILDLKTGVFRSFELPDTSSRSTLRYAGSESNFIHSSEGVPKVLHEWRAVVLHELAERDRSPPPKLDEEAIEKLRSMGYVN